MTPSRPGGAGPWRLQVVLLGLVTIGAYGVVLYGFGAFVGPIRDDTGWSNTAISAAFSISTLGGGLLALTTGCVLDRLGALPVLSITLVAGAALLLVSTSADRAWQFVATWGAGGAIVSAGLFYNVTMAVTARITVEADRARAFSWLTVIGGLASPIAFPLAGALLEQGDWRTAVRWMVLFMVACTLPALGFVRGDRDVLAAPAADDLAGFPDVRTALASSTVRRWLVASSAGLAGLVAIQVHHVAAIEATGVSIGLASTLAGVRGLLSLPGRAVAGSVASRLGVVNALRLTYLTMTLGTLALVAAGAIAWVWLFVVLTGLAFGSVAPLQGLYAAELYGQRAIGSLMGMQQVMLGLASAAGPLLLGLTIDLTDGYLVMLLLAVGLQVLALTSFRPPTTVTRSA
ncbi:MAG: MFS transporter [Ilumatobacter sp.]|uniref:MFS transporter n=1 Tax=Ilumatobacter sp. TaxID=1967498 RepID=UPI00260811EB|nr:MFS transporter [Ilumatobacter sp.]MDJ0770675.1 MFS transporter [Ilumatobacter sp.]